MSSFNPVFFFTAGVRWSEGVVLTDSLSRLSPLSVVTSMSGAWSAAQGQQKERQEDISGAVDPRRKVHTLSRYTVHGRAVDIVDGEVPRGRLTH